MFKRKAFKPPRPAGQADALDPAKRARAITETASNANVTACAAGKEDALSRVSQSGPVPAEMKAGGFKVPRSAGTAAAVHGMDAHSSASSIGTSQPTSGMPAKSVMSSSRPASKPSCSSRQDDKKDRQCDPPASAALTAAPKTHGSRGAKQAQPRAAPLQQVTSTSKPEAGDSTADDALCTYFKVCIAISASDWYPVWRSPCSLMFDYFP